MLIRANERAASGEDLDLFHALRPIFETVAMAKVGTSAEESRELGFLRREDGVSMNRERQGADAKEVALSLARGGYKPAAATWQEGAQTIQITRCGPGHRPGQAGLTEHRAARSPRRGGGRRQFIHRCHAFSSPAIWSNVL